MTKQKKKQLSERKAQNLKKSKNLNPFEIHVNRQKFNILGRKLKSDRGLPGLARQKAIKKRKETLLQEYKGRDKANKFYDRRIGEKNSAMTHEDRIIARYTAEKMKQHQKKDTMNLANNEIITHKGKSVAEIENFDEPVSDEDNDMKGLTANFVGEAHFGGGFLKKSDGSRAAIIDQLIAESKKRKAERQHLKEKTVVQTEELDAEWKELIPLVNMSKPPDDPALDKKDSYDVIVNELKFEPRGTPSDKLKLEEELIEEEARKLRELEEERLRRMRGEKPPGVVKQQHRSADDLDDGFDMGNNDDFELLYDKDGNPINLDERSGKSEDEDDEVEGGKSDAGDENEQDGGSDLEDENEDESQEDDEGTEDEDDEDDNLSDLLVESASEKDESSSGEEEKESDHPASKEPDTVDKPPIKKKSILKDDTANKTESEPKNEEEVKSQNEEENEEIKSNEKKRVSFSKEIKLFKYKEQHENTEEPKIREKPKKEEEQNENSEEPKTTEELLMEGDKLKELMDEARKQVPYTFAAPADYEEFQELLKERTVEEQAVIVERTIKCNHPKLLEKNKEAMNNLFLFLMQHLNDAEYKDCWSVLSRLSPYLFELTQFSPSNSAYCLKEVLKEKHTDYLKRKQKYPHPDTLIYLKLIPLLFPTSDKRHPVTTPAFVFLSSMLYHCQVTTRRSVASGLFCVSLLTEYLTLSKRVMPAALNFLKGILSMATPPSNLYIEPPFKKEHKFLYLKEPVQDMDTEKLKMFASDLNPKVGKIDDEFRIRTMNSALCLLSAMTELYQDLPARRLLFEPIRPYLDLLEISKYPLVVQNNYSAVVKCLDDILETKLCPLVAEQKKPKVLRLYTPDIKTVYESRKRKGADDAKSEHEKLVYKYKKEMKGAIREIRRDRAFLADLKFKEQAVSDAERKRRVKEIFAWGADQQGELNKIKRQKKKK